MSKIKLTGDTSGYVEISAPNVAANNTLELGGGTKILTNLDNVFTGVTTYSGNIDLNANLDLGDDNIVRLGTGDDFQIYHDGSNSYLSNSTGELIIRDDSRVRIRTDQLVVNSGDNTEALIYAEKNGGAYLYHNASQKFVTTTTGATVTGTLVSGSVTSELDLTAISSSISDTAVDVFVYDTRKDSDGGAWRKRTQHTSWYNETLNTATRGSRKEFPAVAVLVLEATKLTIYDGDDPDLPMWMIFTWNSGLHLLGYNNRAKSAITAINGDIIACGDPDGVHIAKFVSDDALRYTHTGFSRTSDSLANRVNTTHTTINTTTVLVASTCNDIAATVLPNAPVDDATGLPVPTIATATDGGVSVIKDDGTVVDITASGYTATDNKIDFDYLNNLLYLESGGFPQRQSIPSSDIIRSAAKGRDRVYGGTSSYVPTMLGTSSNIVTNSDGFATGSTSGLSILDYDSSQSQEMVAYATTSYNTGYMHGDIKGAFLSDTDTTNVTASSAHYTETFTGSGDNTWGLAGGATMSGGVLTLANLQDSRATDLTAVSSLTTGQKYIAEIEIVTNTSQVFNLDDDGAGAGVGGNTIYGSCGSGQTGTFLIAFTKTASPRMRLIRVSGGPATITSFKIYTAVEEDRSVNNKGAQVFGTITKQPVATGAELVSYSGWSSSNYLIQPYNSDLNFGTGNWCYMFWYNPNDAESGDVIFSRWSYNVDSNQGPRLTAYFNSGNLRFDTADASAGNGYQGHFGSDGTQDSNEWHCAVILRRGPNLEIWIDGKNYKTATLNSTSDGSYTDTNSILEIGHSPNSGAPEAGLELALFRVSGTAPSPEQIKKMYEDEKVLFQENAKATLYGSSDAVTALAYDEDTELLHVGTSSGRSDFQGLRRINNTTTAVTTAISASDELIAEQ